MEKSIRKTVTMALDYDFALRLSDALRDANGRFCGFEGWEPDELSEFAEMLNTGIEQPTTERMALCQHCQREFVKQDENDVRAYCSNRCWNEAVVDHIQQCRHDRPLLLDPAHIL